MSLVFSPETVKDINLPLNPWKRAEKVRQILHEIERVSGLSIVKNSESSGSNVENIMTINPHRFMPERFLGRSALRQAAEAVDTIELFPPRGMEK